MNRAGMTFREAIVAGIDDPLILDAYHRDPLSGPFYSLQGYLHGRLIDGEILAQGYWNTEPVVLSEIPPAWWVQARFVGNIAMGEDGRRVSGLRFLPMPISRPRTETERSQARPSSTRPALTKREIQAWYKRHLVGMGCSPDVAGNRPPSEVADIEALLEAYPEREWKRSGHRKVLREVRRETWGDRLNSGGRRRHRENR
jgi:hypothetical protein